MTPMTDWGETARDLQTAVRAIGEAVIPETDLVDAVGVIRAAETRLAEIRRGLQAEMPANATGRMYRQVSSQRATRSYNTNKILADMVHRAGSFAEAMMLAVDEGALRLSWQWTALQKLYRKMDLPMTVISHEIEDGDPEGHVGEVWETVTRLEALPEAEGF